MPITFVLILVLRRQSSNSDGMTRLLLFFGKAKAPLKRGNNPTTPNFHLNSILKKIWISRDLVIKLLIVWTSIFRTHSVAIFTTFFPYRLFVFMLICLSF